MPLNFLLGCILGIALSCMIVVVINLICFKKANKVSNSDPPFNKLKQDAFWFSEDVPTMQLLHDLSNKMDVCDARRKWRKAISRFNLERVLLKRWLKLSRNPLSEDKSLLEKETSVIIGEEIKDINT